MYRVLSEYSFEELAEYISKSRCRLTRPKFESFWNFDNRRYSILQSKIVRNKIILKRPHAVRRGYQRHFVIKATEQAQGTLLEGRFVIPTHQLVFGILFVSILFSIHIFGLFNVDKLFPTHSISTDLGKILLLTALCCWGYMCAAIFLFAGRLIYRKACE